jgi:hypothetical protein
MKTNSFFPTEYSVQHVFETFKELLYNCSDLHFPTFRYKEDLNGPAATEGERATTHHASPVRVARCQRLQIQPGPTAQRAFRDILSRRPRFTKMT